MHRQDRQIDWGKQGHAKSYTHHSSPQFKRNMDALGAFTIERFNQSGIEIADLGCGTGGTTLEIARKLSLAHVHGFDYKESVVDEARAHCDVANLTFDVADVRAIKFYKEFDLFTSFFCLQWVSVELLPFVLDNLFRHLKSNGEICLLIPCYDFTHQTIKGVANSRKWKDHFNEFKEQQSLLSAEKTIVPDISFEPLDISTIYRHYLEGIGFKDIKITTVQSTHPMTDEEFYQYTKLWCGCYPWLTDESLKAGFVADVKDALKKELHNEDDTFDLVHESVRIFAKK